LFRDSEKGILLSTDLGARGLHFPKLQKVINYDFPLSTCDYLQRAGRTGRAVNYY
jgi:superfamily II DNA/RNA helicase